MDRIDPQHTGSCSKGCTQKELATFPRIGEPWFELYPNGRLSCTNHLVQCPCCRQCFYTYRDSQGPWGQREPRYWRTLKEGTPVISGGAR